MSLIKPNKNLGQHFLKNKSVIDKICAQRLAPFDHILEIGPGPVTLTRNLCKMAPLTVVEKDKQFSELLHGLNPVPKIFFQDALKFELDEVDYLKDKKIWLVSNLPYNISSVLTIKFLRWTNVASMTLMYQRELGEKLLPDFEGNSFGALVQSQFETSLLQKLKPGAFIPPPEVHSIVINFVRRENPLITIDRLDEFEVFIKKAYANKRKQLQGILKAYYPLDLIIESLTSLELNPQVRAERIPLNKMIKLFELLCYSKTV
jgi:16S rRNA (adenine1518-N6/adenine1519-N6)-dimethyltransferase